MILERCNVRHFMLKSTIWHHGVCLDSQAHAANGNNNNAENRIERRGGAEPSPLNRSGSAAAFPPVSMSLFLRARGGLI